MLLRPPRRAGHGLPNLRRHSVGASGLPRALALPPLAAFASHPTYLAGIDATLASLLGSDGRPYVRWVHKDGAAMMVARENGRTPGAWKRAKLVIWVCGVGGTWSEEPRSAVHGESPSRDAGSAFVAKESAPAPCLLLSERHDGDNCWRETPPQTCLKSKWRTV